MDLKKKYAINHRKKNDNQLQQDTRLCSLADIMPSLIKLLHAEPDATESFFSEQERDYVIVEDHMDFKPTVNQNIELWALVQKGKIYIRTLDSALTLDSKDEITSYQLDPLKDRILTVNSSFGRYLNEHEKISRYKSNVNLKDYYISGEKRRPVSNAYKSLLSLIDIVQTKIR